MLSKENPTKPRTSFELQAGSDCVAGIAFPGVFNFFTIPQIGEAPSIHILSLLQKADQDVQAEAPSNHAQGLAVRNRWCSLCMSQRTNS